ncbi:MAG: hypothetical protein FWD91_00480 [Treponema sp.]|nr:hypothetical protein [Treponema sp.]
MKNSTKVSLLALTAAAALIMANCANDDSYTPPPPVYGNHWTLDGGMPVFGLSNVSITNLENAWNIAQLQEVELNTLKDKFIKIEMVPGDKINLDSIKKILQVGTAVEYSAILAYLGTAISFQLDSSRDTVRMAKTSNPVDATKVAQQVLTAKQQNQIAAMYREMGLART